MGLILNNKSTVTCVLACCAILLGTEDKTALAGDCQTEYYPVGPNGGRVAHMYTGQACANYPTPEEACLAAYDCGGFSAVDAWRPYYTWGLMYYTHPTVGRYVTCDLVFIGTPPVRDCTDGSCRTGQIWTQKTLPCPNDDNPPAQNYVIKLSNDIDTVPAGKLAEVEPGKFSGTLRATVYGGNGQVVPDVPVRLQVKANVKSGGHQHHNDGRPRGALLSIDPDPGTASGDDGILTGRTSASDNSMHFSFEAPKVAGDHQIKASCTDRSCTQQGADKIWAGVKGLVPIPPVPDLLPQATYQLNESDGRPVGSTDSHPANHYLTSEAVTKLWNLGFRYSMIEFPNYPLLHINDASLERGGLFDLSGNWKSKPLGHHEHRRGTVVDVRANGGPGSIPVDQAVSDTFEEIAQQLGVDAKIHGSGNNRHYHVRLMGDAE